MKKKPSVADILCTRVSLGDRFFLIALLTLGEALKSLVSKRLDVCAEEHGLLIPEWMRARSGRSMETLETPED